MSATNSVPSSGPSTEKRAFEPSMEEILASIRRIIADDQSLPGRGLPVREPEGHHVQPPMNPPPADTSHAEAQPSEIHAEAPRFEPASQGPTPPDAPSELRSAQDPGEAEPYHPTYADLPSAETPPSPIRWLTSEPAEQPEPDRGLGHQLRAHGDIAAPQYAGPDGRAPAPYVEAEPLSSPVASVPRDIAQDVAPRPEPVAHPADAYDEPIEPPEPESPAPERSPLFSAATDSSVSSAFNLLAASRLAANSDELMNLVREMIRPLLRSWLDDNLPSMVERMVRDEIERVARGGH